MAEAEHQVKIPSLAEQWSLVEKAELADYDSTFGQGTIKAHSATASEGIVSDKIVQTPVAEENAPTTGEKSETPKLKEELEKVGEQQEVTENAPIVKENSTSPVQKLEQSQEVEEKQGPIENAPSTEENSENTNPEEEQVQEVEGKEEAQEETPMIKIETAPADFRFPTTNQTRHCFTRYIEYHRCIAAKGDDAPECQKFAKYYRSLCPGEWIERWNEQRENGTFPGPL